MKKLVLAFIASIPFVAAQPVMALEPWHDQSTAKWQKQKAAKKQAAAGQPSMAKATQKRADRDGVKY